MNIRKRIADKTAPLVERWSKLPANMRGALWMLLAGTGFTGMAVCIKLAGQTMPIFVIIVLRAAFALVVISPAIARAERGFFRTSRPGAHILRSVFGVLGISTMMLALTPRPGFSDDPQLHADTLHDSASRCVPERNHPLATYCSDRSRFLWRCYLHTTRSHGI